MSEHALFSASGAHRWMTCPGSLALESGFPRTSSVYADEGTAAHTLAAYCLEDKLDADAYLGRRLDVGIRTFEVDLEMAANVQLYVDAVRERAQGGVLMVEQRVPFGSMIGQPDHLAFGTSDAIIITADGVLEVHDLKYGKGVAVSAEENVQAMLYGLGALAEYDDTLGPFKLVRLAIHQPRISETPSVWEIEAWALQEWGRDMAAPAARKAKAALDAPYSDDRFGNEFPLVPDDKACRFCKAKATCPALERQVAEAITGSSEPITFDDLDEIAVNEAKVLLPLVYNEALGHRMALVEAVESWCAAVRQRVRELLEEGKPVAGFKLVDGKPGNRAWASESDAEAALKAMRLKTEEMFDLKLISPTKAEKLHKSGAIGPRQWPKLQGLITRPEGKPTVVHESDPRPPRQPVTFSPIPEDASDLV